MKFVFFIFFILPLTIHAEPLHASTLRFTSIADGAVVPVNWLHPLVEWTGPDNALLKIDAGSIDFSIRLSNRRAVIDSPVMSTLLKNGALKFTLSADGQTNFVTVTVDQKPLSDRAVYRVVEPLFNVQGTSQIRTSTLEDAAPALWTEMRGTCVGCHDYGPGTALLNARKQRDRRLFFGQSGEGGATVRQYKIGEFSFPAVRSDGLRAALPMSNRSMILIQSNVVEPFLMTYQAGDIAVFNMETEKFDFLPGASGPEWVEDQPSWSADGLRLIFTRYPPTPGTNVLAETAICEIDYHDGKGGAPRELIPAQPGEWRYFPRYSPDGKWISFVRSKDARQGYFFRPDSDIWLLDRKSGAMKKLECNVDGAMDSWHSWSADGRWIAYASKRDSVMTGLWLTRISDDGKASPPVKIAGDPALKVNLPVLIPGDRPIDFGGALSDFAKVIFN